jgi:hypothetical protein
VDRLKNTPEMDDQFPSRFIEPCEQMLSQIGHDRAAHFLVFIYHAFQLIPL